MGCSPNAPKGRGWTCTTPAAGQLGSPRGEHLVRSWGLWCLDSSGPCPPLTTCCALTLDSWGPCPPQPGGSLAVRAEHSGAAIPIPTGTRREGPPGGSCLSPADPCRPPPCPPRSRPPHPGPAPPTPAPPRPPHAGSGSALTAGKDATFRLALYRDPEVIAEAPPLPPISLPGGRKHFLSFSRSRRQQVGPSACGGRGLETGPGPRGRGRGRGSWSGSRAAWIGVGAVVVGGRVDRGPRGSGPGSRPAALRPPR